MTVAVTDQQLAIVVLGAFNPAIFHPSWLAREELLPAGEADAAEVELTHPEASVFTTGWFRFQVTRDRFDVRTEQESHYEALRDLAASCFTVLNQTPVRAIGINIERKLRLDSREAYDAFGWRLAPPDPWSGVLERPGLARLDEQGERTDGADGWVRVKVQPVLDGGADAVIQVNDHVIFSASNDSASTKKLCDHLLGGWGAITERAGLIHDRVLELAKGS